MAEKRAIIIGAGPAGLTAAYELLTKTDIKPIIIEASDHIGGISRTVNYNGYRIDIGGHRFFSKSDRVMQWWLSMLPLEAVSEKQVITYHNKQTEVSGDEDGRNPEVDDRVMLVRSRKSRIYFMRQFFDYPVRLSLDTLKKLGLSRTIKIGLSYIRRVFFPIKEEKNLEQFFINRFGEELYRTFFKSYTEKVWGIDCDKISAEWGAQRIKGLSILKTVTHFLRSFLPKKQDISQKTTETSLIERFLYPKLGPGQMWEEVARKVKGAGGEIYMEEKVVRLIVEGKQVKAVETISQRTGEKKVYHGDYFFSTMPIKELVRSFSTPAPAAIKEISEGLLYRDFVTVGLLLKDLEVRDADGPIRDNWIYVQEPDVKVGRIQIFNNWSPYLIQDKNLTWIGMEYFCNEGDAFWQMTDEAIRQQAVEEIHAMGFADKTKIIDATVLRMPKTYPAYFGTYNRFGDLRRYLDQFGNLFLVGRNGMHKYNNQDHSMLTAMLAVENIMAGVTDKANLWAVNTEEEYHEEKK